MSQGTWHVDDTERETEHTFAIDTTKPLELNVSNVHGRTFVRGADRDDVLVQSAKRGRQDSEAYRRARLRIEVDGNTIGVHPDYGKGNVMSDDFDLEAGVNFGRDIVRDVVGSMFGRRSEEAAKSEPRDAGDRSGRPRYDLSIEVPQRLASGSRVSIRTVSGPAGCADLACRVDASSASGDWHLRAIHGRLTLQTASGDTAIEGINGSLTLRSASGDAQVMDAELHGLNVNTASGDISVEGRLVGSESCRVHTVSGDVQLGLAAPLPSEIGFKSVSGGAFVPAPFEHTGRKTWHVNGGSGAKLAVKTVSGDLHVRADDGERSEAESAGPAASAPEPPAPTGPPAAPNPPTPPEAPTAAAIPLGAPAANGTHPATDEPMMADDASEKERLDLLQALERGEIDVEDAMRRLDELGTTGDAPPG